YQANFTLGSRWCLDGSPLGLFHRLLQRQPTAFSAFFQLPEDRYVLSFSPELFLAWKGDLLWTLPMKGPRPRGSTPDEDRVLKQELVESPKDRAENIMIVDLLRNDLGKLARPGTVQVPRMFQVETYPTVHQMVSRVEARLRPEARTPEALFQALFPGGSVTGAPKLRAVELLQELEPEERGVYCGAIGILFPWKEAVFNLAIRTLALQGGRAWYGVGGGIVLDSRPEAEWSEVENKTAFLRT
ncbi:MAG: chorismate-binding protein, partial [Candidatus Hydrothermae bacterium]|nr:chorismate-binding protein [Candidatus Hydrothermae bacterium]